MAFWSSEKCEKELQRQKMVTPYDHNRIKHGAYELALGPEAFITSDPNQNKHKLEPQNHITIPSGQFALLLTEETVTIPPDVIGFISMKTRVKSRGLINISGFHVDPGFRGRLKFWVYNAGSQEIVLARGDAIFAIWFADLDQTTTDLYEGEHKDQDRITSNNEQRMRGKVVSPAVLDQRLTKVEHTLDITSAVLKTIAIGIFLALFALLGKLYLDSQTPSPKPITFQEHETVTPRPIHDDQEESRKEPKQSGGEAKTR